MGKSLGHYEILEPLGAGGMGEVYRARDTKLERDVALKILPPSFVADADRLARFEREARTLASLNHAHIAQIHGLEEAGEVRALVMELVDGEELSARIARGPIPPEDALPMARQIAAALEAAHEQGVIHRDLKPANIKVGDDGTVKVLDFGLAKAVEAAATTSSGDLANSPTLAMSAMTQHGVILGTAAYMSPEQARGKLLDRRTDIWSFGCVLFEMLSGRPPFGGETVTDLLAEVVKEEPAWGSLPGSLDPRVDDLLRRCLRKDPARRLRDIGEARVRLQEVIDSPHRAAAPGHASPSLATRLATWGVALLGALALLVAASFLLDDEGPQPGSAFDSYRIRPFAVESGVESMPAWSPDGRTLAFAGEHEGFLELFVQGLDQAVASRLTDLGGDIAYPAWDTEGSRIFFLRYPTSTDPAELWVVNPAGGAAELLLDQLFAFAVWPGRDHLAVTRSGANGWELAALPSRGGAPKRLLELGPDSGDLAFTADGQTLAVDGVDELLRIQGLDPEREGGTVTRSPKQGRWTLNSWHPNGRELIVQRLDPSGGRPSIWARDLDNDNWRRLAASGLWETGGAVSPDGARLALSVSPLNWDLFELDLTTAERRPVVSRPLYDGWGSWSSDGSQMVYSTLRSQGMEIRLRNLEDSSERIVVSPTDFPGSASFFLAQPKLSRDDRSVAYVRYYGDQTGQLVKIFVSSLAGSRPTRLTPEDNLPREDSPLWSPSGEWISFRQGGTLLKARASGGSEPVILAEDLSSFHEFDGGHWLPDGQSLIYQSEQGFRQIDTEGEPIRLVSSEELVVWDLSPDGARILGLRLDEASRWMSIVAIDIASGESTVLGEAWRLPVSPDLYGYWDTVRTFRVSPDGSRALTDYLQPEADIWIIEGFDGSAEPEG